MLFHKLSSFNLKHIFCALNSVQNQLNIFIIYQVLKLKNKIIIITKFRIFNLGLTKKPVNYIWTEVDFDMDTYILTNFREAA